MTNEATNEATAPAEPVEGTTPDIEAEETAAEITEEAVAAAKKLLEAAANNPPHTDSPVMHLALTSTSITVLRRVFSDGTPSVLLFVLSTGSMAGQKLPMLTFPEVLEFKTAFEHIINSVIASSSNMLTAPPMAEAEVDPAPLPTE